MKRKVSYRIKEVYRGGSREERQARLRALAAAYLRLVRGRLG